MGKKSKTAKSTMSTTQKGRIVERIVALMHNSPELTVQCNVRLPASSGARKREVDVMLSQHMAGYPVRIAIECKNEKAPIGVQRIDEFISKLQDIQIPSQMGLYVSASGYTAGAIDRARSVGLRTLILKDLSQESLSAAIVQALESTVYLMLEVIEAERICNTWTGDHNPFRIYCDGQGEPIGSLLDLVLEKWNNGEPQSKIGAHMLSIDFPPGWYHLVEKQLVPATNTCVRVHVHGIVTTLPGFANEYGLVDGLSGEMQKREVHFTLEREPSTWRVTPVWEESQLDELIAASGAIAVLHHRYRLPRIVKRPFYWPISERVFIALLEQMDAQARGLPLPHKFETLEEVEGIDMGAVFDPLPDDKKMSIKFVPKKR